MTPDERAEAVYDEREDEVREGIATGDLDERGRLKMDDLRRGVTGTADRALIAGDVPDALEAALAWAKGATPGAVGAALGEWIMELERTVAEQARTIEELRTCATCDAREADAASRRPRLGFVR